MRIDFIRNFIKLTQYKSFSKLAQDLEISQSTLSHQISQIEEMLGDIKLIDRSTRKFELTEEGGIFLECARKIISTFDACSEKLKQYAEDHIEVIKISASTLPGTYFLPEFITKFREKFQSVDFKISINNSQKSLEKLNKEIVDFVGVGSFMGYDKKDYDFIKVGEDELKFICSPRHELLKESGNDIRYSELKKYPFIAREEGSGTQYLIEQQFPEYHELNVDLTINDNDSIISAVSNSYHISILSKYYAKRAEDANLIKILEIQEFPTIAKRNIYFVKLKKMELKGFKKIFWEYLKS